MSGEQEVSVNLRSWSDDDLPLLERLMGDPAMTAHLGGPETPEKIRKRHERYCRKAGFTLQEEIDFEYPPGNFMRCNDWRLDLFADEHQIKEKRL